MKLSAVIEAIESFAPLALQEKWDNSGLQIGLPDGNGEVTGVMICLDTTEEIVAEAASRGCNLIVSHHPLIFKGFKHLTDSTPQERAAAAAIRASIAVYSSHTSLDSTIGGVSYAMAERLGATVGSVISSAEVEYYNVRVICPREVSSDVRLVLLDSEPKCSYSDVEGESMAQQGDFDPCCRYCIAASAADGCQCRSRQSPPWLSATLTCRNARLRPNGCGCYAPATQGRCLRPRSICHPSRQWHDRR